MRVKVYIDQYHDSHYFINKDGKWYILNEKWRRTIDGDLYCMVSIEEDEYDLHTLPEPMSYIPFCDETVMDMIDEFVEKGSYYREM